MEQSKKIDREEAMTLHARKILEVQGESLDDLALKLVRVGSSEIEFGIKRFLLSKSGESHNPGFQIETENLDGSGRFRNSWSALSGDENWQVTCVKNQLARLMATYEENAS
jgi:hypothetical protein